MCWYCGSGNVFWALFRLCTSTSRYNTVLNLFKTEITFIGTNIRYTNLGLSSIQLFQFFRQTVEPAKPIAIYLIESRAAPPSAT
jgi:hypothetical protein